MSDLRSLANDLSQGKSPTESEPKGSRPAIFPKKNNNVYKKPRKPRKMMDTSRWEFFDFKEKRKIKNLSRDKEIKVEKIDAVLEGIKSEGISDSVPEDELGVEKKTVNKGGIMYWKKTTKKLAAAAAAFTFPGNMYSNFLDWVEWIEKNAEVLAANALVEQEARKFLDKTESKEEDTEFLASDALADQEALILRKLRDKTEWKEEDTEFLASYALADQEARKFRDKTEWKEKDTEFLASYALADQEAENLLDETDSEEEDTEFLAPDALADQEAENLLDETKSKEEDTEFLAADALADQEAENLLDEAESKEEDTEFLAADALDDQKAQEDFDKIEENFREWMYCLLLPAVCRFCQIDSLIQVLYPYMAPMPFDVREVKKVLKKPKTKQLPETHREKQLKKMKQMQKIRHAYYWPPDSLFSSDKANDKQELSAGQEQFIQSSGLRGFSSSDTANDKQELSAGQKQFIRSVGMEGFLSLDLANDKQEISVGQKQYIQAVGLKSFLIPDPANDKQELSAEQEEFVQSFGLQSFLEYLKDERKDPPKFLSDMVQSHKDRIRGIKKAEQMEEELKALLPRKAPPCELEPFKLYEESQSKAMAVLLSLSKWKMAHLENEISDLERQLEEKKLESDTLQKLYNKENEYDEDHKLKRAQLQEAKKTINYLQSRLPMKIRERECRFHSIWRMEVSIEQKDKAIADSNRKIKGWKAREADKKAKLEASRIRRENELLRLQFESQGSHKKLVSEKEKSYFHTRMLEMVTKYKKIFSLFFFLLEQQRKEMLNLKERRKTANSSDAEDSSSG